MNENTDSDSDTTVLLAAAAILCGSVLINAKKESKKKKKRWSRSWLQRREMGRGLLNMLNDELVNDPTAYRNFLRLSNNQFEYLLGVIEDDISREDTFMRQAISAKNRLEVTLRFLATGETYRSLMFATRIHETTISKFVPEVLDSIIRHLKPIYLKTPNTTRAWEKIAAEFFTMWNYPHCLGALDGRHIEFRAPISDGSYYHSYKGSNSIVLLALADAQYRFTYVNVGVNGRISDGGVFHQSLLSQAIMDGTLNFPPAEPLPGRTIPVPYVIVADDAFPLMSNIMKPYPQRNLDHDSRIHNYRLSRCRRVIENAFGILANRFRILLTPINLSVAKVERITLTCTILHNFLCTQNKRTYTELTDKRKELGRISQQQGNHNNGLARDIRDEFKYYFNSNGAVEWQEASVRNNNM